MIEVEEKITTNTRLDYLDSMRGIAAFYVVMSHCFLLVPTDDFQSINFGVAFRSISNFGLYFIHKSLILGRASVILFFVLSGFVLASSLTKRKDAISSFIVKRMFRIYPAFFIVVVSSYILHRLIGSMDAKANFGQFRNVFAPHSLSIHTLLGHLMMRGTTNDIGLDSVIWSLVQEMRISLFFPFLFAAVAKYRWWTMLMALIISLLSVDFVLAGTGTPPTGYLEKNDLTSWFTTLYFIVIFVAGILLSLEREQVVRFLTAVPSIGKYAILLFALLCLGKSANGMASWNFALVDYLYMAATTLLIALAIGFRAFQKALKQQPFIWLGRISYSLYLIHVPIIYVTYSLFGATQPLVLVIAVSIAASLLLADLLARTVEFPFNRIGHALSRKIAVGA